MTGVLMMYKNMQTFSEGYGRFEGYLLQHTCGSGGVNTRMSMRVIARNTIYFIELTFPSNEFMQI